MGSLLLSLVVTVVVVAVAGAVLAAISALPFVVAVDMAERRGYSPARWGALELVLVVLAAGVAYLGVSALGWWAGLLLVLPVAALLAWATPLLLTVLGGTPFGGRQGAHEA